MNLNDAIQAVVDALRGLAARVERLERAEYGGSGWRVIKRDRITLQPSLSVGAWLYSNTFVMLNPPLPDTNYSVIIGTIDGPALCFVGDVATNGFTIWAVVDTALTGQSITPTLDYFVVRW